VRTSHARDRCRAFNALIFVSVVVVGRVVESMAGKRARIRSVGHQGQTARAAMERPEGMAHSQEKHDQRIDGVHVRRSNVWGEGETRKANAGNLLIPVAGLVLAAGVPTAKHQADDEQDGFGHDQFPLSRYFVSVAFVASGRSNVHSMIIRVNGKSTVLPNSSLSVLESPWIDSLTAENDHMARPRKTSDGKQPNKMLPVYRVAIGGEIGAAANECALADDVTLTELVKSALKHYLKNVSDPPYWPRPGKEK
jgi:hypothetical protein